MEKYFLGSNTHSGFCGFYDETTRGINQVYLLKGGAGTGKSSLMKKVLKVALDKGCHCESWHCSGDPNSLDGVYILDNDTAVIDATSPHAVEPWIPVLKDDIVNLLEYVDKGKIKKHREIIEKLSNDKKQCFSSGYEHLNIAYCHFAQNRRMVAMTMNDDLIVSKAKEFARDILYDLSCKNDMDESIAHCDESVENHHNKSHERDFAKGLDKRFFRAITPDGVVNFFDNFKDKNLWHIKGESASVDLFLTTTLQQILNAKLQGEKIKIVVFSNPLDATQLDGFMVGDTIVVGVDCTGAMVYDLRWYEGDFDKYAVSRAKMKMKEEIDLAVDYFAKARSAHLAIEKYYTSAMDFDGINRLTNQLLCKIFES